MKNTTIVLILVLLVASCKKDLQHLQPKPSVGNPSALPANSPVQYRGMDLSFSYKIENELGQSFKDLDGSGKTTLSIAKDHGANLVRLRLWVNPPSNDAEASLAAVKAQALRLRVLGLNFYLDIFYSDYWADYGYQTKPASWDSLPAAALQAAAVNYTTAVLTELQNQGTTPVIVETGNEINNGMLWPEFRVSPSSSSNWSNFAGLYNSLYSAVKAVNASIKVMLHIAGVDAGFLAYTQQYG